MVLVSYNTGACLVPIARPSNYVTYHPVTPTVAHLAGAEHLLLLPARLHLQRLTCNTMDALLANYAGCKCSIAALLKHVTLPAERRDDPAPQLMLALLHSASLETLSALCRALVEAECSAHVAALFAKAIRCTICQSRDVVLAEAEGTQCSTACLEGTELVWTWQCA